MQMKQVFKHRSDEYTYNHRHNMLELCNILEKFRMATSKAVLDIWYKNIVLDLPYELPNYLRLKT